MSEAIRLSEALKRKGIKGKDLIDIGVPRTTAYRVVKGDSGLVDAKNLSLIASSFQIDLNEVFIGQRNPAYETINDYKVLKVPEDFKVAAGPYESFQDVVFEDQLVPIDWSYILREPGEYLSFKVVGDSMEPTLRENEVVICKEVEKENVWPDYIHVVFSQNEEAGQLKRVRPYKVGGIIAGYDLISDNDMYPTRRVYRDQVYKLYAVRRHIRSNLGTSSMQNSMYEILQEIRSLKNQIDEMKSKMEN